MKDLFAAAHKYDVPDLLELTGRALASSLTADNVLDVFVLFDSLNCGEKDWAVDTVKFAAKHLEEVSCE